MQGVGARRQDASKNRAKDIVRAVQQHLNAPPEATQVVFVDVEPADWMLGQKLKG